MDISEKLSEFATSKQWQFINARRDYQNLQNITEWISSETEGYDTGQTFIFLDPVTRVPTTSGVRYSGNFLVLTNSDIDMTYQQKLDAYIKPLLSIVGKQLWNQIRCSYDISQFRIIEVVNVFDFNADGVSVAFDVIGHEDPFVHIPAEAGYQAPVVTYVVSGARGSFQVTFDSDQIYPDTEYLIQIDNTSDFMSPSETRGTLTDLETTENSANAPNVPEVWVRVRLESTVDETQSDWSETYHVE